MAKPKRPQAGAALTTDGLAGLVLERIERMAQPSAADLDLARKLVAARRKAHEVGRLTDSLDRALATKLTERLAQPATPTNVLDVARKYLAHAPVAVLEARDPGAERRGFLERLGAAATARGLTLPFPLPPSAGPDYTPDTPPEGDQWP